MGNWLIASLSQDLSSIHRVIFSWSWVVSVVCGSLPKLDRHRVWSDRLFSFSAFVCSGLLQLGGLRSIELRCKGLLLCNTVAGYVLVHVNILSLEAVLAQASMAVEWLSHWSLPRLTSSLIHAIHVAFQHLFHLVKLVLLHQELLLQLSFGLVLHESESWGFSLVCFEIVDRPWLFVCHWRIESLKLYLARNLVLVST